MRSNRSCIVEQKCISGRPFVIEVSEKKINKLIHKKATKGISSLTVAGGLEAFDDLVCDFCEGKF